MVTPHTPPALTRPTHAGESRRQLMEAHQGGAPEDHRWHQKALLALLQENENQESCQSVMACV